jgi:phosphate transport system substrate-binding protein
LVSSFLIKLKRLKTEGEKKEMKKRTMVVVTVLVIAILSITAGYWYLNSLSQNLSGTIEIDGSSTVFPITQAVAEEFQKENPDVRVNVGVSGTGGGFKRFQIGETDINDASRPIKSSEAEECAKNGVEYIEFTIAIDGLAVMVNPQNTWVDYLTVEELNMIWKPESTIDSWDDIRSEWPNQPIHLYGPDTDSGTFDYFTDVINGDEGVSRPDYTASADDNVLVQGIAGDQNSLGYFGYAYYAENTDKLKIVPIDSGNGPVTPSDQTVKAGQYTPLARPIFIYVNKASLNTSIVEAFVTFYMENGAQLVQEVGYTAQPNSVYQQNLELIP